MMKDIQILVVDDSPSFILFYLKNMVIKIFMLLMIKKWQNKS